MNLLLLFTYIVIVTQHAVPAIFEIGTQTEEMCSVSAAPSIIKPNTDDRELEILCPNGNIAVHIPQVLREIHGSIYLIASRNGSVLREVLSKECTLIHAKLCNATVMFKQFRNIKCPNKYTKHRGVDKINNKDCFFLQVNYINMGIMHTGLARIFSIYEVTKQFKEARRDIDELVICSFKKGVRVSYSLVSLNDILFLPSQKDVNQHLSKIQAPEVYAPAKSINLAPQLLKEPDADECPIPLKLFKGLEGSEELLSKILKSQTDRPIYLSC